MFSKKFTQKYVFLVIVLVLLTIMLGAVVFKNLLIVQQIFKVLYFSAFFITFLQTILYRSQNRHISLFRYSLFLFVVMLAMYSIFSPHFDMIFPVMNSILAFYFFYYYSLKGYLTRQIYMKMLYLFFIISVFLFYDIMTYRFSYMTSFATGGGLNTGYSILGFLLLALPYSKKNVVLIMSSIAFLMILFCMKRGAVFCGAIVYLSMLWSYLRSGGSSKNGIKYFFIGVGAIGLLIYVFVYHPEIFHRFSSDNMRSGSGRNVIYSTIAHNFWYNNTFLGFIFGNGFFDVSDMSFAGYSTHREGFYAHSDFYELIWDFGLFGLSLYCFMIYCMFKFFLHSSYPKLLVMSFMLAFLAKAYVSGVYTVIGGQMFFALTGYLMGKVELNNNLFRNETQKSIV